MVRAANGRKPAYAGASNRGFSSRTNPGGLKKPAYQGLSKPLFSSTHVNVQNTTTPFFSNTYSRPVTTTRRASFSFYSPSSNIGFIWVALQCTIIVSGLLAFAFITPFCWPAGLGLGLGLVAIGCVGLACTPLFL